MKNSLQNLQREVYTLATVYGRYLVYIDANTKYLCAK